MMEEYIKEYFQHFGVTPKVQEVSLLPLPADIQKMDIPVTPYNSYKTSAVYLLNLNEQDFDDLHYVLGISYSHCLFGKAVIRVDGQYYDPMNISSGFQAHDRFVSIYEMPVNDLIDFMVENDNELPSILNLKIVEKLSK